MATKDIVELLSLAKSRSDASRSQLVENITDLFLSDEGRLSEHERALMSEILSKLILQVEADVRKELADVLLRSGVDLPEVAKLLANDAVEIARPLLEQSELLKDPDLIEIIRMRTDEHRMAITMRVDLSEQVSDALVEYGSEDVLEALLNNHDSNISKRAMEYMVTESRRVDRFQEPLLMRSDLSGELAYKMYWWVSAALRKKILTDFDVDPVSIEVAVKRAAKSVLVEQDGEDGAYVKAQKLMRRMHENDELTMHFLTNSLRQQRIAIFVAGLAELGHIDFKTTWRIFNDPGGQSFAILARAIGVDRNQFTSVFLLMSQARGSQTQSPGVLKDILVLYDSVTEDTARGALEIWQRDNAYQIAVDQLEKVS